MTGLQVEHLSVRLGAREVLREVSLEVEPGAVVALVGPNGAGKSTLLRGVAGVHPSTGSIRFGGADLLAMRGRDRARVLALVEQEVRTEFAVTVRQAVDLGRTPHRSLWGGDTAGDTDAVTEALKRADAEQFADRLVGDLSGGEQQRVHLARALAQEPRLLLLDEPTNHLDVRAQLHTLGLLRELASGGVAVLAALHDLNLAAAFCDRVVVLADGRVRAAGPVAEVLTAELIGEVYGVPATVLEHPRTGRPLIAFG